MEFIFLLVLIFIFIMFLPKSRYLILPQKAYIKSQAKQPKEIKYKKCLVMWSILMKCAFITTYHFMVSDLLIQRPAKYFINNVVNNATFE